MVLVLEKNRSDLGASSTSSFRTRVRIAISSCLQAWKADTTSAGVRKAPAARWFTPPAKGLPTLRAYESTCIDKVQEARN
jgi:hypothetical protein